MLPFVREHWDVAASSALPLHNQGGFSGAKIWQVHAEGRSYCLRRWPRELPTLDRLRWIHQVLFHCCRQGFEKIAIPLVARSATSVVTHEKHRWQLENWIAGEPDASPDNQRLTAAFRELARFHLAAHTWQTSRAPAPSVAGRCQTIDDLQAQLPHMQAGPFGKTGLRVMELFRALAKEVRRRLVRHADVIVTLQPCMGDVWHEHVLFDGNEVSGFIDFGLARMETIALDLARLLGSMAGDDQLRRQTALVAYEQLRPLSDEESRLIPVLDDAAVLCSGMNWLSWVTVQGREFASIERVGQRVEENLKRLEWLYETR